MRVSVIDPDSYKRPPHRVPVGMLCVLYGTSSLRLRLCLFSFFLSSWTLESAKGPMALDGLIASPGSRFPVPGKITLSIETVSWLSGGRESQDKPQLASGRFVIYIRKVFLISSQWLGFKCIFL